MQLIDQARVLARNSLRALLPRFNVRGRHRFVDGIGSKLGADLEVLDIGGLRIEIRHDLSNARMMFYGVYELHLVNWIRRNIRAGDTVIEPGVNVGFISGHLLKAVGAEGLVVGLEPSRRCFSAINENNTVSLPPQFRLLNAAVSAADGNAWFLESARIHSHGYGCLEAVGQPDDAARYSIATRSVDSLMEEFDIDRLRFLKLDVEGSELPALLGAAKALSARRIDNVMVETELDGAEHRLVAINREIRDSLVNAGFVPFRMLASGRLERFDIDSFFASGSRIRTDLMWVLES